MAHCAEKEAPPDSNAAAGEPSAQGRQHFSTGVDNNAPNGDQRHCSIHYWLHLDVDYLSRLARDEVQGGRRAVRSPVRSDCV